MTASNDSNGRKTPEPEKKPASAQSGYWKKEVLDAIDEEDKELVKQTLGFFKHKTGWIGQEEDNLPATVTPAPDKEKKAGGKAEERADGADAVQNVAEKIIGHGKSAFSRALFHLKAWGTGILMEVLTGFIPASVHVTLGATALSSILGMFLLFPYHVNRTATLMGLVTALLCVGAGYWPLAIALGGLVTALIHIVNRRGVPLAFFFVLPVLLIALSFGVGAETLGHMPLWFYGGAGASIVLGVLRPYWLEKLANKVFSPADRKRLEETYKQTIDMEDAVEVVDEFGQFPKHVKELEKMKGCLPLLPEDVAAVLKGIKLKARAILKCMSEDVRDVTPGNQFLNRYLPMLNTTVEQFVVLQQNSTDAVKLEQTKEQILRTLRDMDYAFAQAHQRLISNDEDDLLISLKVMDRLRKSDGYGRED